MYRLDRLAVLLVVVMPLGAACVGPSDDEALDLQPTQLPGLTGQLPSAPCPRTDFALVLGTLEELGGGCVSLRIDRVVHEDLLLDEPSITAGEVVRGRVGTAHAWRRTFERGDVVVAIVTFRLPVIVDGSLARPGPAQVSLFPWTDDRVQIQWGRAMLSAELEELTAPNCREVLEQRREASTDLVPHANPSPSTTTAAAPEEDSTCE